MVTAGQLVAGRYRLDQPLATGGMGGVWLAHDEADDAPVAIKKCHLPDGLTADEQDLFRVWTVREARAYAVVGHPNVVRTLDVLPDDDAPWIVMEYVPSRSLQEVIDRNGPLPPPRVAGIGLAVLEALLAVRRAGLLHLDVKPGNVLIADDGRVVLTDFGPAVTTEGVRALAGAGIILGSPQYLAPERFLDALALPESDLWSLGATLYHAVEGRPPFARATTAETLLALTEEPPDPIELAGPLRPVLDGLLRRDPQARLTPPEIDAALRDLLHQPAPEPLVAPRPERPAAFPEKAGSPGGHRQAALLAGLLVALVALVAVLVAIRPGGDSVAPAAARSEDWSLPVGYYWWSDGAGYRLGLPVSWGVLPGGSSGELTAAPPSEPPGGSTDGLPVLGITVVTPVPADVVSDLIGRESRTGLRDYRRIKIEPLAGDGAVWEYTYQDPKLGALRVQQRAIVDPGRRMYLLAFTAPRDRWAENLGTFDTAVGSFATDSGG